MLLSYRSKFILPFLLVILFSCKSKPGKWEGQETIQKVSTLTLPIQKQPKGIFNLGNGVFCSNDFPGARLNDIAPSGDSMLIALISPENTPINESPWYAFKIWAEKPESLKIKLTYSGDVKHRYYPKLSTNGKDWSPLDSSGYYVPEQAITSDKRMMPEYAIIDISIGTDTTWLAAQEVIDARHTDNWITALDSLPFVESSSIGKSREGRSIRMMKIGASDDSRMMIVLSRQHPPEVTGYLAMTAFVETLCSDSEVAVKFRADYNTYVIPMVNPDGVYHGHWRHNTGGVDLNRDWEAFHQPETKAIYDFMQAKIDSHRGKFYFGIDFHSTYEDIYYILDPAIKGNMPGLVEEMINGASEAIANYEPNINTRPVDEVPVTSMACFLHTFGAESMTYEIGDNTPRELLKKKGEVSAMKLMQLMLDRSGTSEDNN